MPRATRSAAPGIEAADSGRLTGSPRRGVLEKRTPTLLLRLSGSFLLR